MLTMAPQCHYTLLIAVRTVQERNGKHMKSSLAYVVAVLLAAIPAGAADTLSGKWTVHQSIAGNESDMSCTFTQNGEDLVGTCDGAAGEVKIAGKVSENKVSWTFKSEYNGSPLTMKYTGTLASATKITGTVSVDPYGVEGEFAAASAK